MGFVWRMANLAAPDVVKSQAARIARPRPRQRSRGARRLRPPARAGRFRCDETLPDRGTCAINGPRLGIHSRIERTVARIAARLPHGNVDVNRNMIGAGRLAALGGSGLSGTGPKAGCRAICTACALRNFSPRFGLNAGATVFYGYGPPPCFVSHGYRVELLKCPPQRAAKPENGPVNAR